jgi:hypothetical protein
MRVVNRKRFKTKLVRHLTRQLQWRYKLTRQERDYIVNKLYSRNSSSLPFPLLSPPARKWAQINFLEAITKLESQYHESRHS